MPNGMAETVSGVQNGNAGPVAPIYPTAVGRASAGAGAAHPSGSALARPDGGPHPALPCLNSNNCDKEDGGEAVVAAWNLLSGNHKKTAFALGINVQRFIDRWGLEKVGFLTVTFGDHVVSAREAQRRLHNFLRRCAPERWLAWIIVFERMKSFRVHFHLLVAMPADIRTGFDFEAASRGDYRSASPVLRSEWAWLRKTLPGYGFGRSELLPLRKDKDVVALYVGKYIAKSIGKREEKDKGIRLVRYSKGAAVASVRFQFVSKGSARWRRRVGEMASECGIKEYGEWAERFGPKWAWMLGNIIAAEIEETEDSLECPAQPVVIENKAGQVVYWDGSFRSRKFGPGRGRKSNQDETVIQIRTDDERREIERMTVENGREWSEWRLKGGWL